MDVEQFLPGLILGGLVVGVIGWIYLKTRRKVRDIRHRFQRLTRLRLVLTTTPTSSRRRTRR